MGWIRIIEHEHPKLRDPVLVQGLPGLGLVGKIAVDYLIEELKPPKIAELYSDYLFLPDGKSGVLVELDGVCHLPRYEFYAYANAGGGTDMVLLAGDTQPVSWAQYVVAEKVIFYAKKLGVRRVVTLGGTLTQARRKEVYAVANSDSILKWLSVFGVKPSRGGAVTGACGVMVGLATLHGMEAFSLMGNVSEMCPDPEAAKAVLEVLIKMFKIPVSLRKLEGMIKDMKMRVAIAQRLREYSRMLTERRGAEERREEPGFYV
ncbi:MAG: proteasome assembly chaperone family protein [Thermoprotei archaeon]|nr:MAG: proteasome assembly chaperone family protein [Thermoprotei archaeon]